MPVILLLLLALSLPVSATAANWYCDPVNGDTVTGDGTQGNPWGGLQETLSAGKMESQWCETPCNNASPVYTPTNPEGPIKAGDTVYMMSGYHGYIDKTNRYNASDVTFKAYLEETPELAYIDFLGASHWVFDGISISPSHVDPYVRKTAILIETNTWNGQSYSMTIKNCDIFSKPDIAGWVAQDWIDNAATGIHTETEHMVIEGNSLYHSGNGITTQDSPYGLIKDNTINHISGDGIQMGVELVDANSDFVIIEGNTIKNVYTVDETHKDMIQLWTKGDTLESIIIRGNTLIISDYGTNPLTQKVQGIGAFDGRYNNITIENNLIITNTDHGITVQGSSNGKIINNTVTTSQYSIVPNSAPIRFWPGKGAEYEPGSNNILRNNFATYVDVEEYGVTGGVINDYANENIVSYSKPDHFIDVDNFDYNLIQTSTAIGGGITEFAPTTDITGATRSLPYDIGAYEYNNTSSSITLGGAGSINLNGSGSINL